MPERFDVVVIGGGPAGSVAAMLLARSGCSVAIVDRPRTGKFHIGETLSPQASRLMACLHLSEPFQAQEHRPSPGIVSAWGSAQPATTDFVFSPHGNGWHIDRPKFNAMLLEAAVRAGAAFFNETGITECAEGDGGWSVRALRAELTCTLKCRCIVDASGRGPAGAFGLPRRIVLDRLIAAAALCPPAPGACPSDFTLVEAVDEGWFYSALLPSGEYVLAYMTDGDLYAAGRERSNSFLEDQLAKAPHTRHRIERIPPAVALFSSVTSVREKAAGCNWLAAGDAARSYDPLSGLGLWTAMKMASQAAPVILEMLEGKADSGVEYDRANRDAFAQYQTAHQMYYGLERRWPGSEFWQRRQR